MAPDGVRLFYENEDTRRLATYVKNGYRTIPIFYVNGQRVVPKLCALARPNQTLLQYLRETLKLTGSKLGCAEGGCGACTVMISKLVSGKIKHYAVNACLMPVLAADGCHVTTIEGIGTVKNDNLHPIQRAMVEFHGSQCGFCTPGIIVSIYTLLTNDPTVKNIEENLDGNLCRCTGYRPIWDAARSLCQDGEECVRGSCGVPCRECPERETCTAECNIHDKLQNDDVCCSTSADKMKKYKDTFLANQSWLNQANEMFPKELTDETSIVTTELNKPLVVVDKTEFHAGGTWFKPNTLMELLKLLHEFGRIGEGACKMVVGNTEVGIETRFKHTVFPRLICPSESIRELFDIGATDSNIEIGSCCSLTTIQETCKVLGTERPHLSRTVMPIHNMLRWFGSTQIRNVACLGGNLVTASPISDMNPMLVALRSKLILASFDSCSSVKRRSVNVSEFFLNYRKVDLAATEIIECIEIPIAREVFEYVHPFKQARRREDDISIVTSGMRLRIAIEKSKYVIEDAALAFGGMAPTTIMANKTVKTMVGAEFCSTTFEKAAEVLLEELSLPEVVPGGQAAYRTTLAVSFFHKFFLCCVDDLQADLAKIKNDPAKFHEFLDDLPAFPYLDDREISGKSNFLNEPKPRFTGVQRYPTPKDVSRGIEENCLTTLTKTANAGDEVGKAVFHMSGPLHCTGEAQFADDIPAPERTLHAALLLANECGRIFKSMDTSAAMSLPGIVGVFGYEDLIKLGGNNELGPLIQDEVVFLPPGEIVRTHSQVLAIVVAESLESAEVGARLIDVAYGELQSKIIVTVDDAIEAGSFYVSSRHCFERGDPAVLSNLERTSDFDGTPCVGSIVKVSGTFRSGAQEHFYLEPHSTLVVPSESNTNLTIYCATQGAGPTQRFCASATGTPASKVVVRVKRLGGGFGGKETRTVFSAAATAVAAKLTCRPVRLTLGRDVDMKTTGTRHVFVSKYQASALLTESGAKLIAINLKLFSNGGSGIDVSVPILDRALLHVDGCYNFPNFRVEGIVCKTAQPPHTAFRGFGGPQGMAVAEHVLDHLAVACKIPGDQLRRSNMYKEGDYTPYGMIIGGDSGKWNVPAMWDRLYSELNIPERRAHIREFNSNNRWVKRGISVVPTKFGVAFTVKFMNQGGSLVHVYTDGTVLVSHGGTEMGQGLHTKICQVAAQAFGIPVTDVYVNDTSTDKVANAIPTSASLSTDMYGMATLDACRQILSRLEPIRKKLAPEATFKEVVEAAHMDRVDLSAHGFYALDDSRIGFDWDKEKPDDFPEDGPANSWKGHPFNYFTQGVACTEVEVDLLSGNHRTLRSDVIVDAGSSINPAIDIGQVEGAWTQGMGWSTIEEVIYACDDHKWINPRGSLFTTGPGTYKIPSFNDVPEIFNVSLLENVDNPFAVHSSKAIGEPPLFLGSSVFYAIKDAIISARKENLGDESYFEMRMPATSERIRMYSADIFSQKAISQMLGNTENALSYQPQGSY